MTLAGAHIRIARPTNDIENLLPFYRDALGFEVLGSFTDHEGFDGIMLGLGGPSSGYHLEFTLKRGHAVPRCPTEDNLLIFYLPDEKSYGEALARMEGAGCQSVPSFNPYWDRTGKTFEDADGYRVVLTNTESPV